METPEEESPRGLGAAHKSAVPGENSTEHRSNMVLIHREVYEQTEQQGQLKRQVFKKVPS